MCWYATLCWVTFANPEVNRYVQSFLPPEYAPLCERCLYSRDVAETLRKKLWYEYTVGDNVDSSP